MSYTTPPTFVADDILAASDLNILSDDIIDLDARAHETAFMGVSLLRTSSQTISDDTLTAISWVSAPVDVGGWWTSGTDIVVPAGAIPSGYTTILIELHGQTRADVNGTGSRSIVFQLNGSDIEIGRAVSAIAGDTTSYDHLSWAEVAAADVITMIVKQTSGGNLAYTYSTFHVKRLGPLS